ncbi:MAG: hypothetical protein WA001_03190 [Patescibacteria group bacterium]
MTASRHAHILIAFEAELAAYDKVVLAFAGRFGGDQFNLIECRWALEGFMASLVAPYAFTPSLPKEQLDAKLKQAYAAFSGEPEVSPLIMDIAWMRRLKEIAAAQEKAPFVESLVTTKFVSDLNGVCEAKCIVYPSLDMMAIETLQQAILRAANAALDWRLRETDIAPDFREIAGNTASAIVFYSIVARVTRHTFAQTIRPFEELLQEGMLPLGLQKSEDRKPTAYAIQLYKEPERDRQGRSLTPPKQTVAVDLGLVAPQARHAPDGTLYGIGGPQPAEPRLAFMQAIQALAAEDPQIFNEAFRLWSGFMRKHATAQGFVLGPVKDEDGLRNIIAAATGNMATQLVVMQIPALLEIAEDFEQAAQEEREDRRVIIGRGKPTVRNVTGNRLWNDPYRNESYVLDPQNPERVASHKLRQGLRALLETHLMPSLDASLIVAGLVQTGIREVVATTIQHTFFNLFDAALHLAHPRALAAARLAQVHVEGVIPLGFRGHAGQAFCRVLASK